MVKNFAGPTVKINPDTMTYKVKKKGHLAQSVTCLTTNACLTADSGITSLIPSPFPYFRGIDHEMLFMDIFLPSDDSFKKGCCQLHAKVCAQSTG